MVGNLLLQPMYEITHIDSDTKEYLYNIFLNHLNAETSNQIHPLLKELADEINSIDDIAICNGEQGNLGDKKYGSRHHTYLEFYALDNNFRIATALLTYIVGKMEGSAYEFSKIQFNEIVESYSEHEWIYRTRDNLTEVACKYSLSFGDIGFYHPEDEDIIKECIEHVKEFKKMYSESPTELFYLDILDYVEEFDDEAKEDILKDADIDTEILGLCNAINSFKSFLTINSCQGSLNESTKYDHCPITYVDFYVASHNYYIANALLVYLSSRMEGAIKTSISLENGSDIYIDENGDEVETCNDIIAYRYKIDLTRYKGRSKMSLKESLDKTIMLIEEFKEKFGL